VLVDDLIYRTRVSKLEPTFFEVVTIMALRYFAAQRCDVVIWETGLGGRLDATNIVTPIASVITNVQLDHQQWLGNTIADIAREKAGIIKRGVPCFTAAEDEDALQMIAKIAAQQNAVFWTIARSDAEHMRKFEIPLAGEHQLLNAALATATVRLLGNQISVSENAIANGLKQTQWPGRFQVVKRDEQTIVLDGAHNPAGAMALATALRERFAGADITLVLGAMQDKDVRAICGTLAPLAKKIFVTRVGSERAVEPAVLLEHCRAANPNAEVQAFDHLGQALSVARGDSLVVVTGSLHFIGEALEFLQLSDAPSERELNEYMPKK
jgi:dihydrofolate synthase/folylpolyglutamate synthase